jgi:hypothetical protein
MGQPSKIVLFFTSSVVFFLAHTARFYLTSLTPFHKRRPNRLLPPPASGPAPVETRGTALYPLPTVDLPPSRTSL